MSDFAALAAPARRALAGAGIGGVEDLARRTEAGVAALHGMGPNAMLKLKALMAARGVAFRHG